MLLARRFRELVLSHLRALPLAQHAWARYRARAYESSVAQFTAGRQRTRRALPPGVVYEATMRCNLHCEFCYVGDLLNIEGEWREELPLETLRARVSRTRHGLQVSLTGGEIFMRKDILDVMDVVPRERLHLRLSDDQRHDHHRRARGGAREPGAGGVSQAHQRVDRRPRRAARSGARREGHLRAHCGGPAAPAGRPRRRKHAPLRVSINTTVAHETLDALDQMVDVADELGVDAIGLNHLMYSTPEEVAETVRLTRRERRPGDLDLRHAPIPARCRPRGCARRWTRSRAMPRARHSLRHAAQGAARAHRGDYYTPGTPLDGRCLYPFLHARVSFSGKAYFCPFIRIEVGDLTKQSLEEVWTGERYVALRRTLVRTGCSRSAAAAARSSCRRRPSRRPRPSPEARAIPLEPGS